MKRLGLLFMAVSLAGCQLAGGVAPGKPTSASTDRAAGRIGGLAFGPLTSTGASYLNRVSDALPATAPRNSAEQSSGMPAASAGDSSVKAGMPAPMPPGSVSGMPAYSYYGNFVSGPLGPMKLESATEAKAPGAVGAMRVVIERVVKPVLGDWAADAALVGSAGTLDAGGNPVEWSFIYASASHREAMLFFIGAQESRVILLRWEPIVLDVSSIKVDSAEAIQVVRNAVENAAFSSREEVSGQDFFMNQLSGAGIGWSAGGSTIGAESRPVGSPAIAVPPTDVAVAPQPPAEGERDATPSQTVMPMVTQETLHTLAPGGTWSIRLEAIGTYQVWDVSYSAPATAAEMAPVRYPPQAGDTSTYSSSWVSAIVDARTGEVIRLSRPTRITTTWVSQSGSVSSSDPGVPSKP